MEKILVSIPDSLAARMRAAIPVRQRSKIVTRLIEQEVKKREQVLYECACELEKDARLSKEMDEWNITLKDGLNNDESW